MEVEDLIWRIWISFLLFCFCLLMSGCKTEYVPIEVVRYDSLLVEKMMRDSVFVRDSIYIKEKGDTIYANKDKYIYVLKQSVDTIFITRWKEVEVPIPVERKLSWWEQMKLDYAEWMLGILVAVVLLMKLKEWAARRLRKE